MTRKPTCGNDPRAEIDDTTRATIDEFREYLRIRKELAGSAALEATEEWRVLGYDAGDCLPMGLALKTLAEARRRQAQLAARAPGLVTAVARRNVTWTVEPEEGQ